MLEASRRETRDQVQRWDGIHSDRAVDVDAADRSPSSARRCTSTSTRQRLLDGRTDHDAAHRRDVAVVPAPRQRHVAVRRQVVVRRVEVDPALLGHPHRAPRVRRVGADQARAAGRRVGLDVPAHVARREARACAGSRRRGGRSPGTRRVGRRAPTDSGVDTSVNVGSYSNSSWMTWHRSRAASTTGRCGVNASSAMSRSAAPCSPSAHVRRAAGERPHGERVAAAQLGDAPCGDLPRLARRQHDPRLDDDLALGVQRQRVVGVVDAELQDAVPEHVDVLGALVRLRLDAHLGRLDDLQRRRARQQVGDGVPVRHRDAVGVRRAVRDAVAHRVRQRHQRIRPRTTVGLTGVANHVSTTSAPKASTALVGRADAGEHVVVVDAPGELGHGLAALRPVDRRDVLGEATDRREVRARVVEVVQQQVRGRGRLDVAAVVPAVGDEALVRRQEHLQRGPVDDVAGLELHARDRGIGVGIGAQACVDEAEHDGRALDAPAEVAEAPRRAVHRALVPQPDERSHVGDARVEGVDGRPPVGELVARGSHVAQHTARGHGEVLGDGRRLGQHRGELLAHGARRRHELGVEHDDRAAVGRFGVERRAAHDAQDVGHAQRPAAPVERRQRRVGLAA